MSKVPSSTMLSSPLLLKVSLFSDCVSLVGASSVIMSFVSLHYIFPLVFCDHDRVACTDPCFKLTKGFLVLCTWIFTYKAPLQQEILLIRIKNGLLMCIPSISTTMQLAHFSYGLLQMMIIV